MNVCVLGWFSYKPVCVTVEREEFIDSGGLPDIKRNRKPQLEGVRNVWNS